MQKIKKISCKCIDIPIIIVTIVLLTEILFSVISESLNIYNILPKAMIFPTLSIFANLIIFKMIQITMRIKGICFRKLHIITIGVIFLLFILYYSISLWGREFIYYWDFSNYLIKQYTLENAFSVSIKKGMADFIYSLMGDYTSFINLFTEFPFCLTSKTGNWYVMIQIFNVFLPLLLCTSCLIIKIGEIFSVKNENAFFVVALGITTTFPLLHKSALQGLPDWFGLIFCLMIVCLTIDYKFKEKNILLYVILFTSTVCLVLTRRWYLYFIVGYYFSYALFVAVDVIKTYRTDKKQAIMQFKNIFVFAIVSVIVMAVGFNKMIRHILEYDYGERYASYLQGGFSSEIMHQISLIGVIYLILMGIGVLYSIRRKNSSIGFIPIIGAMSGLVMFTNVQNMGSHQSLLLLPFYFVLLILGIVAMANLQGTKYKCLWGVLLIGAFNCIFNYSNMIKMDNGLFADCNLVVESRNDIKQVKELATWIDNNCEEDELTYIIPHDAKYNPDTIRNSMFPYTGLYKKVSYGAGVLGTHPFPTELFDAKYIITCKPFPNSTKEITLAQKYNKLFCSLKSKKFNEVKTFDMGNGVVFYVYARVAPVDIEEINYYFNEFKEEDMKFPDLFRQVRDNYIQEHQQLLVP